MADARISIGINADVGNALTGLQKVNGSVSVLQRQFDRLQKLASMPNLTFRQQERLNGLLQKSQRDLQNFQRATEAANPAVTRFTSLSNSASLSLLNFGRVAQDAPFGILGIANNLNPLFEGLQRTSAAAKAAGVSLRSALGKALLGPAGIGIAISVVSGLLIAFRDKIADIGKSSKDILFRDFFSEAAKGASEGIAKLELLRSKLTDLNVSQSDRVKLAKEYNETADKANQLDLSQINNIGLTNTLISRQIALITERAKARAAESILAEKFERLLKAQADAELKFPQFSDKEIKVNVERINNAIKAAGGNVRDFNEILAFADLDPAALQKAAESNKKLGILLDANTRTIIVQGKKQIDAINAYRKGVGGAAVVRSAFREIEEAQKDVNDALRVFSDILTVDGLTGEIKVKADTKEAENNLKRLAKAIQEVLVTPDAIVFKDFDTDKEALNKAKATVQGFFDGTIFKTKLQVQPQTFTEPPKPEDLFPSDLSSLFNRNGAILGQRFVDGFTEAAQSATGTGLLTAFEADILFKEFEKEFAKFGKNLPKIDIGKSLFANREDLSKQLKQVAASFELAKLAANTASQAFGSAFDALFEGENVADAVANSFKALIKDIARAIIQTLIFKAVSGLFGFGGLPGSGAAGIGGIGGQIAGLGGLSTPGGQTARLSPGLIPVQVSGQFVQRGNVMVATISQTQISQGRNG